MRYVLALLLIATTVHAQDDALARGRAARDAGDHVAALAAFSAAWDATAAPVARAEMSLEELALARFSLAETHASEALAFAADPQITAMAAQLTEARDAAASHLGSIEVRCAAGCTITVDGIAAGTTPLAHLVRVEAGAHVVHADLAGSRPADARVDVASGGVARVTLAPEWIDDRPILARGNGEGARIAGWSVLAAGAVALVIGAIALGVELDRDSFLRSDACTPTSMLESRETHCPDAASVRATYTDVARVMLVSAAVLGAAGLILLLTAPSSPAGASARCMPSAAPGFVCQVTF